MPLPQGKTCVYYADAAGAMDALDTLAQQVGAFAEVLTHTLVKHRTRSRLMDGDSAWLRLVASDREASLRRSVDFLRPYVRAAKERGEVGRDVDEREASLGTCLREDERAERDGDKGDDAGLHDVGSPDLTSVAGKQAEKPRKSGPQERATIATMNVSLPGPMKAWVEAQTKDGRYSNASDYVRDLIRRDQERKQAIAGLQQLVDGALASGVSERGFPEILDAAKREARQKGLLRGDS